MLVKPVISDKNKHVIFSINLARITKDYRDLGTLETHLTNVMAYFKDFPH